MGNGDPAARRTVARTPSWYVHCVLTRNGLLCTARIMSHSTGLCCRTRRALLAIVAAGTGEKSAASVVHQLRGTRQGLCGIYEYGRELVIATSAHRGTYLSYGMGMSLPKMQLSVVRQVVFIACLHGMDRCVQHGSCRIRFLREIGRAHV